MTPRRRHATIGISNVISNVATTHHSNRPIGQSASAIQSNNDVQPRSIRRRPTIRPASRNVAEEPVRTPRSYRVIITLNRNNVVTTETMVVDLHQLNLELLGHSTGGPPPLANDKIATIPQIQITAEQHLGKLQCTICIEVFQNDEMAKKLPCNVII